MIKLPKSAMPETFLVVVKTDKGRSLDLGRRFQISLETIRLGNIEDVDIPVGLHLPDKCHVELRRKNESWYVYELSTRNHVSINGISIQTFKISDGDLLKINDIVFEFCSSQGVKFEFFEDIEKGRQLDLLTGAYNRGYFYNVLEWEISRHKQKTVNRRRKTIASFPPMSLIMLDIDHFGEFNKKFEHQVGDEVLKGVVARVKTRIRSTDIVARYGGEEFLVYLPDTGLEQAIDVAEQVRTQVESPPFAIYEGKKEVKVTISLGVAQYEPSMDLNGFVREADLKMLSAKKTGRNRVVF